MQCLFGEVVDGLLGLINGRAILISQTKLNLLICGIFINYYLKFSFNYNSKTSKSQSTKFIDAWDYEFNFSHLVNMKKSLTIGGINCLIMV